MYMVVFWKKARKEEGEEGKRTVNGIRSAEKILVDREIKI